MLGKSILAGAVAAVAMAGAAQGALTINQADISGGQYVYTLNYSTFSTKFLNDVNDRYFMDPYTSGSSGNAKYVRRATTSFTGSATFTYKFDFTAAGYQIDTINTRELLNTYTNDGIGAIHVKYSTDGTHFTEKYKLQAASVPPLPSAYNYIDSTYNPSGDSQNFYPGADAFTYDASQLNGTSVFYYRVEFEVIPDSNCSTSIGAMAWGRRGSSTTTDPIMFQATFGLKAVPEPTSLVLVGLVGCGLMARKRREA